MRPGEPMAERTAWRIHNIADKVVVADAGILSSSNLRDLDETGLRFIVGPRVTKAPKERLRTWSPTSAGMAPRSLTGRSSTSSPPATTPRHSREDQRPDGEGEAGNSLQRILVIGR